MPVFIVGLVAAVLMGGFFMPMYFVGQKGPQPVLSKDYGAHARSVVKVKVRGGHGSGVIIRPGYVVTAAHVIESAKEAEIVTSGGSKVKADVLWSNAQYDIALLHFKHSDLAEGDEATPANLSCGLTRVGDAIHAVGNPGPLEFVHSWGHVSSKADDHGYWKSAYIATVAIAPGSSGGPVFDPNGNVVGITVGISLMQLGMFPAPAPFAYVVPSSAVCFLMGTTI
jgi:S1-C subfamily serine protease